MLLNIQNFGDPTQLFCSKMIFNDNYINFYEEKLLEKNWKEICYIYEDYDLYDIYYELQAVGLPENTFYSKYTMGFTLQRLIEIIEFEIDGKKSNYKYKDYSLEFDIHLNNLEMNKIHLKYKKSKLNLTSEEQKVRKYYRSDYYGMSKNKSGQNAIYILILKCDFEIINFKDPFLVKIKEGEYKWGGIVPKEGKKTVVELSKKNAKYRVKVRKSFISKEGENIKDTTFKVPLYFEGGNNEILKLKYYSKQTDKIEIKKEEKIYEIKYKNINDNIGEFFIEGEIMNRCKGEWDIDFNDEELEKEIPEDYKYNKAKFKELANKIIKNYNIQHKNDL